MKGNSTFEQLLSSTEINRAQRILTLAGRGRFMAARGLARTLLSRYTGDDPEHLSFSYGATGKPAVQGNNPADIRFNLSHSGLTALYAFALGCDIGIDVEETCRKVTHDQITRRFFTDVEIAELESLPLEERGGGFLRAWTRT